jgi:hypothetical protein
MRRAVIIAIFASCLIIASPFAVAGVSVDSFTISGGKVVELPMKNGMPESAKSGDISVEACGPLLGPSKADGSKLSLIWAVSISVPKESKYQRVAIEEVSTQTPIVVLAKDQPQQEKIRFNDGKEAYFLQVRGQETLVAQEETPWVFTPGITTLIFRVTLVDESGVVTTLYQPARFGDEAKAQVKRMVERAANKAVERSRQ